MIFGSNSIEFKTREGINSSPLRKFINYPKVSTFSVIIKEGDSSQLPYLMKYIIKYCNNNNISLEELHSKSNIMFFGEVFPEDAIDDIAAEAVKLQEISKWQPPKNPPFGGGSNNSSLDKKIQELDLSNSKDKKPIAKRISFKLFKSFCIKELRISFKELMFEYKYEFFNTAVILLDYLF